MPACPPQAGKPAGRVVMVIIVIIVIIAVIGEKLLNFSTIQLFNFST
jgi:type III secretory pathway component EscS